MLYIPATEETSSYLHGAWRVFILPDDSNDPFLFEGTDHHAMAKQGENMWIFYKHLPRGVSSMEIWKATLRGTRSVWSLIPVKKKGVVKRSKIIQIMDLDTDSVEYHAIVQVESPKVADSIIRNLDGKTVNGLFLKPHRYHRRFPNRDRRVDPHSWHQGEERRTSDRRRDRIITRVVEIS